MKTNIQAVNFEMTKKLEEYINKKLSRFARHLADDDEVVIRMNVVKPQTKNNKQVKVQIAALFAEKKEKGAVMPVLPDGGAAALPVGVFPQKKEYPLSD